MRLASRILLLALSLPAGAGLAACKRKPDDSDLQKKAPPPPDRLAPDELAEGAVKLHGLRLPRRARVLKTVGELTFVRSDLTVAQLSTYVRARVEGGKETPDKSETRWDAVSAKGGGGPRLDITVRALHDADDPTEMVLHPLPASTVPANASEEERWRAVGATPNGKLIDSQKRE